MITENRNVHAYPLLHCLQSENIHGAESQSLTQSINYVFIDAHDIMHMPHNIVLKSMLKRPTEKMTKVNNILLIGIFVQDTSDKITVRKMTSMSR